MLTLSPTAKSASVAGFLFLVILIVEAMLNVRVPSVLFWMEIVLPVVSTAVTRPRVVFGLAGVGVDVAVGVDAVVEEVWAWVVRGALARAKPTMAARAGDRKVSFIGEVVDCDDLPPKLNPKIETFF
jgi:hypothetical protein